MNVVYAVFFKNGEMPARVEASDAVLKDGFWQFLFFGSESNGMGYSYSADLVHSVRTVDSSEQAAIWGSA